MTTFNTLTDKELDKRLDSIVKSSCVPTENKLIYLAAPWFDKSAEVLYNAVKRIGANTKHSKYNIYYPRDNNFENPCDTFYSNVQAINCADCVVALVSRKDVGTAWEIGYAYAINKKVYLVGYDETCFTSKTNLMLAFSGKCFTVDKLSKFLRGELDSTDYINIGETWEGIE